MTQSSSSITLFAHDTAALDPRTSINERFAALKQAANNHQASQRSQYPALEDGMAMLRGDMWLNGRGWIGPQPAPEDEFARGVLNLIQSSLISQNILLEITERAVDAIAGEEPDWNAVLGNVDPGQLSDTQRAGIGDLERVLTSWWDESDEDDSTAIVWGELKRALTDCIAVGRGVLRLYIPESLVTRAEDGTATVQAASLAEALSLIRLERCDPATAGIMRRRDGTVAGAYFTFADDDGTQRLEWHQRESDGTTSITVESKQGLETASYDLERRLMIFELRAARPLITPQLISQQKELNLAHTMVGRNTHTGGFLERTILNGQMPGTMIEDDSAPNGKRWIGAPYRAGAGTTNFIAPATVTDEDGRTSSIPASIDYREPVDIEPLERTVLLAERSALHEARQAHILMQGDANASGRSRESAISDFKASVTTPRDQLVAAIRWTLRTALLLAEYITMESSAKTGFEGQLDLRDIRFAVNAPIRAGLANPEDVRVDLEMMNAGALSMETVQTRSGRVIDPDAERSRIVRERETSPFAGANAKAVGIAGKSVQDALYAQSSALRLLGTPEDQINQMVLEKKAELEAQAAGL